MDNLRRQGLLSSVYFTEKADSWAAAAISGQILQSEVGRVQGGIKDTSNI